jgi:hypothetical protein
VHATNNPNECETVAGTVKERLHCERERGTADAGTGVHDPTRQPSACSEPLEEKRCGRHVVRRGTEWVEHTKRQYQVPWLESRLSEHGGEPEREHTC